MAQEFHAAFGLGGDDRHISTVDPAGVALAAIQALYEQQKTDNDELRPQIAEPHRMIRKQSESRK